MKNLIQHIENLLPDHDCVVVPGLGGFVQNEITARFDSKADMFYPERKEICFNARLTFNDGFLAQAYQKSFGLSFEDSNLQIRQGVQELKDKIDEGKYVSLGRIGVMWKNDQGQMAFRSENKNFFFPESYGLTSFTFPCIKRNQSRIYNTDHLAQKRKDDEFINIRLRRNSFRNFMTGAAACLFMILLSKPAGNLPETNNQEAFMMHDYLVSSEIPKQKDAEVLPVVNESAAGENIKETDLSSSPAKKDPDAVKTDIAKPEITTAKGNEAVQPTSSARTYYIVISSFPQKKLAEEWIQKKGHGDIFKYSGIVEKDGRSRVYARCFPDKEVAEAFLNQFRVNNPEYASAWLLCAKNS